MNLFLVVLFFIVSILLPTGCMSEYNLATQQEESLMYGTEKEVALGDAMSRSIDKYFEKKIVTDIDINERVGKIFNKIVDVCDRNDIVFFFKIIDEDQLNAVSLPGGYIYIFKKLVDETDDDELAGVIAHEIGHITARHAIKRLQASYAATLLQIATAVPTQTRGVAAGVNMALNSVFTQYSQQDEFQADALAVKYMKKAGYDPKKMISTLQKLRAQQQKDPIRPYSYWRTHPYLVERMGKVNTEITGKSDFRDYIRTIGGD